ncbi:hypothetical protein [Desulfosporosinus sp. SB140]|uniref:hypothetical protein n=1 Tax=Desulfosporosinus paludis TaxID=3115649 RepID=UPI003890DA16
MKNIRVKNLLIVLTVALLLEFGVFNFDFISAKVNPNKKYNLTYTMEKMQAVNWTKQDNTLVSRFDPNLIIPSINTMVNKVNITVDADKSISNVVLFYTNNKHINFSAESMITDNETLVTTTTIDLNQQVKDLRIDLGDNPGLVLKKITVIINPIKFNFSISRIIAILLMYLATIGLSALQKGPDYKL